MIACATISPAGGRQGVAGPVVPAGGHLRRAARRALATLVLACVALAVVAAFAAPAFALKPIVVAPDQDRIEITTQGEIFEGRGDNLQVETAPSIEGLTGRMSVRAVTSGTNPNWIVFALRNQTDKPIERWVTAERHTAVGSGVIWPDLDARRIEALTPSIGFIPERVKSDRADIFRITLEPGQTITYVAELSSERFARIHLWKPIEYEIKVRERQLFNGIMLGLVGLLAIFLTAIFAANHKAIFPSAALVSWCVLAYLCVDFGFWHKLFQLRPEDNAIYRSASEAAIAASLVIFLHTFLRFGLWHGFVRVLMSAWMIVQLSLIAVAVVDPRLAATFARISFIPVGVFGMASTLWLAARGQDRALSLIPTWMLLLVWIFGAAVALTGRLAGEIVVSGLVSGLVLIVMLIGFTVTQYAFRSLEPLYGAAPNDLQLRALAVDGAGAAVWEWNAKRDELKVSPIIESALGLMPGELSAKVDDFIKHMHQADRERYRLALWSLQERNGGSLQIDFRMRHADNSYRWFEIEAASVPSADRRTVRCVGLMRDVTDAKRAHERLLHDAVHDSLTGLPNRELFLDRLGVTVARAKTESAVRPTIVFIDMDKFKSVNDTFGLTIGDSLLLTIARRLQRHLTEQDTLARVGGDQFAILLTAGQEAREIAALAERIRRSLRSPIKIAGQDIVLTGSLGIAVWEGSETDHHDLLKEAEIAMYRAKRGGNDRIEIYHPDMRADRDEHVAIESELRKALEKEQLKVFYQPIVYLPTEELAGFEALVRWDHPKHGPVNPASFVSVAEESDLIVKLGSYVLTRAARDAARWHKELPRPETQLFVSVNVSSRQLFRQDLIQEIRHIIGRSVLPKGALKLEITESLVMENPEQATEMLEWLRAAGAELALDDFGTGYSSLAYLQRFPFDTIKIDKALVQSCTSSEPGSAIVRSMVALSHELGKKVVAEGVETQEDVGFLRAIGCEFAQGFFYGEAMPDRDVVALLRVIRKSERKLQRRGFFRMRPKADGDAASVEGGGTTAAPRKRPAAAPVPMAGQDQSGAQINGANAPNVANGTNGATAPPAAPTSGRQTGRGRPVPPGMVVRPRQKGAPPHGEASQQQAVAPVRIATAPPTPLRPAPREAGGEPAVAPYAAMPAPAEFRGFAPGTEALPAVNPIADFDFSVFATRTPGEHPPPPIPVPAPRSAPAPQMHGPGASDSVGSHTVAAAPTEGRFTNAPVAPPFGMAAGPDMPPRDIYLPPVQPSPFATDPPFRPAGLEPETRGPDSQMHVSAPAEPAQHPAPAPAPRPKGPDFSTLPPSIAASLAKLAGVPAPGGNAGTNGRAQGASEAVSERGQQQVQAPAETVTAPPLRKSSAS